MSRGYGRWRDIFGPILKKIARVPEICSDRDEVFMRVLITHFIFGENIAQGYDRECHIGQSTDPS